MKIKSKRSHIIDTSGTGLFLLAPGSFERRLPICFPFSIQEIAWAELQPKVPVNLWLVCIVHFFLRDDGFAQSSVAVTAGFRLQAHPLKALCCQHPIRLPGIWQK